MRTFQITVSDGDRPTLQISGMYDPRQVNINQITALIHWRLEGPVSEIIGVKITNVSEYTY